MLHMQFVKDTRGGEIPEWAGIVGLLAFVLVGGFTLFRNQLNSFFGQDTGDVVGAGRALLRQNGKMTQ